MLTISWRPLLAVCASFVPFVSFAQAPTTFSDTFGVTQEAATAAPAPIFRNPPPGTDLRSWVIHWNEVAINASGVDHTPVASGENRVFGEQIGPGRSARAIAIVQIAVFDALVAVNGGYTSYTGLRHVSGQVSTKAAVAYAAHDTLVALFPSQKSSFDAKLQDSMRRLRDSPTAIFNGVRLGKRAADAILELRAADGSQHAEPVLGTDWNTNDYSGHWRQDPISRSTVALGAHWGEVRPFVMTSTSQFRVPPPPVMTSAEYTEAKRGQASRRRRREYGDRADCGSDVRRRLLGLRWHAEPVRTAAALQPDRSPDRQAARQRRDGYGAVAGARQCRVG